jgi:two-component sensor histidine kinase
MALIHEQLYQSKDLANINFSEYITSLVNYIRSSHARTFSNITIRVDIAEMTLDIDRAVPLGLIISELVSNSIKYAFPAETGNKTGEIWVKAAQQSPGSLTLEIGDSGRGLPDDVDIEQPSSMGLQLVQDFVLQLNGRLVVQRRPGAIFTIVITPGNNHYG